MAKAREIAFGRFGCLGGIREIRGIGGVGGWWHSPKLAILQTRLEKSLHGVSFLPISGNVLFGGILLFALL
jgi:hypothetical protein